MISPEDIIRISRYLTKIHHVKGRIRVRVSPDIEQESKKNGITLEDIKSLPQKIDGIKKIKINKIIGSITITYDNGTFPYELWEDLLAQKDLEKISEILNELAMEVME